MGLYTTLQPTENCLIGIWHIQESLEELRDQVDLGQEEQFRFDSFKSDRRKIEWLAVRVLLKKLTNAKLYYAENGSPKLSNGSFVSISHTKGWIAIVIDQRAETGIDIESISSKAFRIHDKFAAPEECKTSENELEKLTYFTLLWACKEAIYKKYSAHLSLEFKTQIHIPPFSVDGWYGEFTCYSDQIVDKVVDKMGYVNKNGVVLVFTLNN